MLENYALDMASFVTLLQVMQINEIADCHCHPQNLLNHFLCFCIWMHEVKDDFCYCLYVKADPAVHYSGFPLQRGIPQGLS